MHIRPYHEFGLLSILQPLLCLHVHVDNAGDQRVPDSVGRRGELVHDAGIELVVVVVGESIREGGQSRLSGVPAVPEEDWQELVVNDVLYCGGKGIFFEWNFIWWENIFLLSDIGQVVMNHESIKSVQNNPFCY